MEMINTPYDDAFRTLLQDCPELVIPLINELFGTNYTGQEVVITNSNENFLRNPEGKKEKRITDSNLSLRNCREIICIFLESMLIYVMNEFSDSGGHFHGT